MIIGVSYYLTPMWSSQNISSDTRDFLQSRSAGETVLQRMNKMLGWRRKCRYMAGRVGIMKAKGELTYAVHILVSTTPSCQPDEVISNAYDVDNNEIDIRFDDGLNTLYMINMATSLWTNIVKRYRVMVIRAETKVVNILNTHKFEVTSKTYCPEIHLNFSELKGMPEELKTELTLTKSEDQVELSEALFQMCWETYLSIMSKHNGVDYFPNNAYVTAITMVTIIVTACFEL